MIREGEQVIHQIAGYNELAEYYKEIKFRLIHLKGYLELWEIEERKNYNRSVVSASEERIKKLEQEERMKSLLIDEKDYSMMDTLKYYVDDVTVIPKEELTNERIQTLLRKGYKQVNEYCVDENKVISVLVYPPLNHSPTHAFLVWSVKKYLKNFSTIDSIKSSDTRSADITFRYKHKYYAIEIETGKSIRHKKRMQEKVQFLDSKFPNRWFFLVSNRALLPKYRKLGPSVQRSELTKMLQNMLVNRHPKKASVKSHSTTIKN